jgi:hypothetical protein
MFLPLCVRPLLQLVFNITFLVTLAVLSMTLNDKSNNVKPDSSDLVTAVDEKFLAEQLLWTKMDSVLWT